MFFRFAIVSVFFSCLVHGTPGGQYRLQLRPGMLQSSSPKADFSGLVDEQLDLGDPPSGKPKTGWKINSRENRNFPFHVVVDLERPLPLAVFWFFDTHNVGKLKVETGKPGNWSPLATVETKAYQGWKAIAVDRETRYLRIELLEPSAIFTEIALDAYSPQEWGKFQEKVSREQQMQKEREAELARARAEALKRPQATIPPFGRLSLVDEVLCAGDGKSHLFSESPKSASGVKEILGKSCRVVPTVAKRGSYISYRLGTRKLLRPGGTYVLAVEYPEDAPRSMVVINTGNETLRGFHTGLALGDALHPKYVNNHLESLDVPLSGKWEKWTLLFRLHDRFPEKGWIRGTGVRPLTPEDGFDVTLCQFPTRNQPLSKGIAVHAIRLYEVLDPETLCQPLHLPPKHLPHRRLFWREEMADGVIADKDPVRRGLLNELDWYRNKADLMRFLGMNTYSKDLLEFGACQHWDSTPGGGDQWVYHDRRTKGFWKKIVALMGKYGFEVLPYYEYSGSKGRKGLGFERRCKPLGRDDAYTHIKWIESANADITDPDTYVDFQKMLKLTVVDFQELADFAGVWLRPRSQLPVSFADATRKRFADEANQGRSVSRDELKSNAALYRRYLGWWEGKRREFFVAMRDFLEKNGVKGAFVLYTGCPAESGVGFGDWEPRLVTDAPDVWREILSQKTHFERDKAISLLSPEEVFSQGLFLRGLLSPGLTWGGWEVQHAQPADDPQSYRGTPGVMLSHAINRSYTVDPVSLEAFRAPAGLTVVRHYTLNENMMFDEKDEGILGYFVADVERAGPFSMMAEALAVANGDPTQIGYLCGGNFGRGFPLYARNFNANFLALPALLSKRISGAASDGEVVVRSIETRKDGTYLAVVNTSYVGKKVKIRVPPGKVRRLADSEILSPEGGNIFLTLYPFQLVALGINTP